jgi:WD40 repeat protein
MPGKTGIIFSAIPLGRQDAQIIWLPAGSREARPLSSEIASYPAAQVSANGKLIGAIREERLAGVYVMKAGEPDRATPITPATERFYGVEWTPDNTILTSGGPDEESHIFRLGFDGTRERLTEGAHSDNGMAVSPDGRWMAFRSNRGGRWSIWRADRRGRNAVQISGNLTDPGRPSFASDGGVVFDALEEGQNWGWKAPPSGGAPVKLGVKPMLRPVATPRSSYIACEIADQPNDDTRRLAIFDPVGQKVIRSFPDAQSPFWVGWKPDASAIFYLTARDNYANVWLQNISGSPARPLTHLAEQRIFAAAWCPDGDRLAYLRGVDLQEIHLLSLGP